MNYNRKLLECFDVTVSINDIWIGLYLGQTREWVSGWLEAWLSIISLLFKIINYFQGGKIKNVPLISEWFSSIENHWNLRSINWKFLTFYDGKWRLCCPCLDDTLEWNLLWSAKNLKLVLNHLLWRLLTVFILW